MYGKLRLFVFFSLLIASISIATSMGLISEFKDSIASHGIHKDDILRASGFFVGLNIAYIALLWTSCFLIRPTERIINRLPFPKLQAAFAKGQRNAETWRIFKRLPVNIRGVMSVSFCEMLTFKGLLGPVALPVKIWLAAKLAIMTRFDTERREGGSS